MQVQKDVPFRQIVLHVITGLRTGGAERMLCQLLSVMDRRQWDPVVISLTDGSGPEAWLREQGIPVHNLGMQAGKLPSPGIMIQLIRLVRTIRPALIHGWMYHGNLAAQFANYFLSPRPAVLWSIHHSIGSLSAEKNMTIKMIRLGARLSGLPDTIVYASRVSCEQHLSLGYRAEKARVIPNGVDPGIFIPSPEARAAVRKELGLNPTDLVIGHIARYHPMKDHENFLRAAGLLSGRSGGVQFLLAGTGVDSGNQALQTLIRELGIADRIHLLGERKDTDRLLAATDLFTVSSSHGEALPMVLLEAMSCGVTCVTTDIGDAALLVGDSGRVVAPRDPVALSGAWSALIAAGEEQRRTLGGAARSKILTNYTLSATGLAYEGIYRDLAG